MPRVPGPSSTAATNATVALGPKLGHGPKAAKRPRQTFYQKYEGSILGGSAVLVVLGIWEAIWSYTNWISPLFFSGPSAIAKQFWYTLTQGTLLADLAFSGKNFAIGFGIALVTGVVVGVIVGWYRRRHPILRCHG